MVYILKLLLAGLLTIPTSLTMVLASLMDRRARIPYRLGRMWCKAVLFLSGIEVKVSGGEKLDANQAYVFMANHQSNIDIPALMVALDNFQLCLVAKRNLLRIPGFGWGLWACRMITIDRGSLRGAKSSIEQARQKLKDGVSIVVFPEGTRSTDGRLLPFKRGGFVIAHNAQAAIVPITIRGSRERLARGSWRVAPGMVEIIINEVVPHDEPTDDSRNLARRVREIIGSSLASANPNPAHLSGLAGPTR